MLRDEKAWDPATMIRTTKSFGGTFSMDEQTFQTMRPKENSDQRKSRLCREVHEAKQLAAGCAVKSDRQASAPDKQANKVKPIPTRSNKSTGKSPAKSPAKATAKETIARGRSTDCKPKPANTKTAKTRRARKPVPAG